MADNSWKEKHIILWEQARGKLPEGLRLIFADGDAKNCSLDNLIPATKREIFYMNRHSLFYADAGLTRAALALARHSIAISDKLKKKRGGDRGHYTIKRMAQLMGYGGL